MNNSEIWIQYWYDKAINHTGDSWSWIKNKTIEILKENSIPDLVVGSVKEILEKNIKELSLDLNVKVNFKSIDKYIQKSTIYLYKDNSCINCLGTDPLSLSEEIINSSIRDPMKGGQNHANVILLDRYLTNDMSLPTVEYINSNDDWGVAGFDYGTLFLALADERKLSKKDIKIFTTHEFLHPIGIDKHHNNDSCVMNKNPETGFICDKCFDAITFFWKGLKDKTKLKYFI